VYQLVAMAAKRLYYLKPLTLAKQLLPDPVQQPLDAGALGLTFGLALYDWNNVERHG
jgi:hypothetical protein